MKRIMVTSDISFSVVTVGMMRIISSRITGHELELLISRAIDNGIDTFDHAMVYGGNHACETYFGQILKQNPDMRKKITLISKFGIYKPENGKPQAYYDYSSDSIQKSVDESLKALSVDRIDVMLIHRPSPFANPSQIAETSEKLIRQGKIGALGVSNYLPSQMRAMQKHLDRPIAVNQVEMSLLATNYLFDGTSDYCHEVNLPLMAWSPMAGGRLMSGDTKLLQVIEEMALSYSTSTDAIGYAWLLSQPLPITVITGSMKWSRIEAAIQGTQISLSAKDWFYLLEVARGQRVP
jgi:predicted oxidoreductase